MKVHCAHDRMVAIDELRPHPLNANVHPADQVDRLAEILAYQGWRYPVKVSNRSGFVTAGHGRIEAAKKNGWHEVPVNFQDYDDQDQELADVHADNAIAAWAHLDLSRVNSQIPDFDPSFNVDMLGLRNFKIEPADLPTLPTGDRNLLRQMAFQITEEQEHTIDRAISISKKMGDFGETGSSNSNGNALARMAEIFITQHGSSEAD